jgi:hypothetical protein
MESKNIVSQTHIHGSIQRKKIIYSITERIMYICNYSCVTNIKLLYFVKILFIPYSQERVCSNARVFKVFLPTLVYGQGITKQVTYDPTTRFSQQRLFPMNLSRYHDRPHFIIKDKILNEFEKSG